MSLYELSIPQLKKSLTNLDNFLTKGDAYAATRSFEPAVLLAARLAPDQYTLARQVQVVCDNAKHIAAYLTGKPAPKHPDDEVTLPELRARIRKCSAYLETFTAADFDGAESRMVPLPFIPGKGLLGVDYLLEIGLPNFYFHLTVVYEILRHNGVPLGKGDYIGSLKLREV